MPFTHTHYTLKRESLVGTLEAPRGVRQMNGVPQSSADRSATAESRVRTYWSNLFTVLFRLSTKSRIAGTISIRLRLTALLLTTSAAV